MPDRNLHFLYIGIISDALGHQDTIVTRTYLDSFGSEEIDKANEKGNRLKIKLETASFFQ